MREFDNKDLTVLNKLSTEEIRSVLESDAALEMDSDVLLYMLKILEDRDALLSPPVDDEEALRSIRNDYLTDETLDIPVFDSDTTNVITIEEVKRKHKSWRFGSRVFKPLITAALAIVLLFTLSFGAMAAGVDVFGAIARWTEDFFGFARYDEDASVDATLAEDKVAPVLEQLHKDLVNAGVTEDVLPAFIPEGYIVQEYSCYAVPTRNVFVCALDNNGSKIILSYIVYSTEMAEGNNYHKNAENPREYVVNDLTHYIMSNEGETVIVWMNGNVECSISGMLTEEHLIEIVESVYME